MGRQVVCVDAQETGAFFGQFQIAHAKSEHATAPKIVHTFNFMSCKLYGITGAWLSYPPVYLNDFFLDTLIQK